MNIKSRKKQLNAIKNIKKGSKLSKIIIFFSGLSLDAEKLLNEIKEEQEEHDTDPEKLVCTKSDGKFFNFSKYLQWQDYIRRRKKGSIQDAKATGTSRRVR